jgi:23S rRNA (uracil1939-C5)-methyltransferase
VAYPEQLRLKGAIVRDLLEAALGRQVEVAPTLAAGPAAGAGDEAPWGFRSKVHFVTGPGPGGRGVTLGHYRRGTQDLLPVVECPVHAPAGNRLAFAAAEALGRARVPGVDEAHPGRGVVRHVLVRVGAGPTPETAQTQLTLVARRERFDGLREVTAALTGLERPPTGLHLDVNDRPGPLILGRGRPRRLHGRERLLVEVADVRFLVSPGAFFQTNVEAAARLVEVVLALVPDDGAPVLDLFSGVGLFSLPLARRGHEVLAVEESRASVQDGVATRGFNQVPEAACRFTAERAEAAARRLRDEGRSWPTVIVDPPRGGCPPGLLEAALGGLARGRLIYVSCDPTALAPDLARAERLGWRVDAVQPVDMFPHTAHVETVVLLTPRAGGRSRR